MWMIMFGDGGLAQIMAIIIKGGEKLGFALHF